MNSKLGFIVAGISVLATGCAALLGVPDVDYTAAESAKESTKDDASPPLEAMRGDGGSTLEAGDTGRDALPQADGEAGVAPPGDGGGGDGGGGQDADAGAGQEAGCPLYGHDNGLGSTWQDCFSVGTWSASEAMKACQLASAKAPGTTCLDGKVAQGSCGPNYYVRLDRPATMDAVGWFYFGTESGTTMVWLTASDAGSNSCDVYSAQSSWY